MVSGSEDIETGTMAIPETQLSTIIRHSYGPEETMEAEVNSVREEEASPKRKQEEELEAAACITMRGKKQKS